MPSESIYSRKKYWDDRYEEGPFGDVDKGIGNEWLVPYFRWRDHLLADLEK